MIIVCPCRQSRAENHFQRDAGLDIDKKTRHSCFWGWVGEGGNEITNWFNLGKDTSNITTAAVGEESVSM